MEHKELNLLSGCAKLTVFPLLNARSSCTDTEFYTHSQISPPGRKNTPNPFVELGYIRLMRSNIEKPRSTAGQVGTAWCDGGSLQQIP